MSPVEAWLREYMMQYGEAPELRPSRTDYDYASALRAGAYPQRYEGDGMYHWPSKYKKDSHPTKWMEDYSRAFDRNPLGEPSAEKRALRLWNSGLRSMLEY